MTQKKKPRIGRPPLRKKEKRNLKLEIRLNSSESESIEGAAKKAEREKSEWARGVLLTEAKEVNAKGGK